jgi:hypothetical protein
MPNPNVPQGVLNKALATVSSIDNPELNVAIGFLGAEGISLTLEGDASAYLATMTGAVPSPNPMQLARVTMHLLKSQGLSDTYKTQFETDTSIGDTVITPDANTLSPYYLSNCTLMSVADLPFNGSRAEFTVTFQGVYQTNSSMFQ